MMTLTHVFDDNNGLLRLLDSDTDDDFILIEYQECTIADANDIGIPVQDLLDFYF